MQRPGETSGDLVPKNVSSNELLTVDGDEEYSICMAPVCKVAEESRKTKLPVLTTLLDGDLGSSAV